MDVGTEAWIADLDRALGGAELGEHLDPPVTVGYRIADGREWSVTIGAERACAQAGTDDADVTFVATPEMAAALADGTADVQRAVAAGHLSVEGDVRKLVAARSALAVLRSLSVVDPTNS